ncbi:MAG: hypothetical protein HQL88_08130 [Magnetococcales bacterium]|nr:hypothetical protein [Magnetococcales bacterium]
MKSILARLDLLLDRLSMPERLGVEEGASLLQEWDETMALLEHFPETTAFACLPAGERLYLQVWLQRIQQRLPAVQSGLLAHKSELAKQLFSENRRFQSLNSRYAADTGGSATLHQGA